MRSSALVLACVAVALAAPLESLSDVRAAFGKPTTPPGRTVPQSLLEWDSDAVNINPSYRSEYIDYDAQGEVHKTLGCNKPDCLVAAKVEGPLPTRLAPRADRSYKSRPFVIQREDGKEWDKRNTNDASAMHFKEDRQSLLQWDSDAVNINPSYRSEYIDYDAQGEVHKTLGCNKPDCLVAAKVEGPLPTRLAPRADRSYKSRPFVIQREDGKEWDKRNTNDASAMHFKEGSSLLQYKDYFEPEEVASSYRGEYISYHDKGEVHTSMGCNKPDCLVAAKVEGPLPTRLAPHADRSYKSRPFLIQREDGKEWDKRNTNDASAMH